MAISNFAGPGLLILLIGISLFLILGLKTKLISNGLYNHGEPLLPEETYKTAAMDAPPRSPGKKRLVWVMHSWVPNVRAGSEITAEDQINYLQKKGWEVFVLVHRWVVPEYNGTKIYPIRDTNLLESPGIVKLIKSADILAVQNFNVADFIMKVNEFNKPVAVFLHTQNDNRDILNFRMGVPIYVVYNVNFLKLESNNAHPGIVVHPKVDTKPFKIEKKDANYVTLVNCNENKGGQLLPKLARSLPDIQFLGIKGGYSEQIEDPNPPANLKYLPTQTDMTNIYKQTKLLIMPSKSETWGRTAVEAMSSGTPVIVSRAPGLLECVGHAVNACDRNDTSCWVEKVRELMTDKQAYAIASKKALERVDQLDKENENERLEGFLTDIYNRHKEQ